jgi:hypothetical protein
MTSITPLVRIKKTPALRPGKSSEGGEARKTEQPVNLIVS